MEEHAVYLNTGMGPKKITLETEQNGCCFTSNEQGK